MKDQVTVIAYHRARQGKEEALKRALLALCDSTRRDRDRAAAGPDELARFTADLRPIVRLPRVFQVWGRQERVGGWEIRGPR